MSESLAAAVVMATGWQGNSPFINPMCGSGTLAIEAALQAQGRAPGLLRSQYGFLHLKNHDPLLWQNLRTEIRAVPKRKFTGPILATDTRPDAIAAARQNARTAGVEQLIEFQVCDFADTPIPPEPGVVVLNPPYGERMGELSALEPVYKRIGDFFKQRCQGYRGYVFTGNLDLGKQTGLRSSRKILFFNGAIECRLLGFELYAGSKRKAKQPDGIPEALRQDSTIVRLLWIRRVFFYALSFHPGGDGDEAAPTHVLPLQYPTALYARLSSQRLLTVTELVSVLPPTLNFYGAAG